MAPRIRAPYPANLTLTRATASASVDFGQIIAAASRPAPAPQPNEYLRGMQFDVRIESAPSFDLQTSLTRDVETEVDLRLRGTPLRPPCWERFPSARERLSCSAIAIPSIAATYGF